MKTADPTNFQHIRRAVLYAAIKRVIPDELCDGVEVDGTGIRLSQAATLALLKRVVPSRGAAGLLAHTALEAAETDIPSSSVFRAAGDAVEAELSKWIEWVETGLTVLPSHPPLKELDRPAARGVR